MNVDNWFFSLKRYQQILLVAFFPVSNVVLFLVHLSNAIKRPTLYSILGLILSVISPLVNVIDFFWLIFGKTFLFYEQNDRVVTY